MSIYASHQFLVLGTNKAIDEICVYIKACHWFLVLGTDEAVVETNVFKSISPVHGYR